MNDAETAIGVTIDPEPDERGNLLASALFNNGRMIALGFNVN